MSFDMEAHIAPEDARGHSNSPTPGLSSIFTSSSHASAADVNRAASTDPLRLATRSTSGPSTPIDKRASQGSDLPVARRSCLGSLFAFFFPGWIVPKRKAAQTWSTKLKVLTLTSVFIVQTSMNFNAAVYGFAGTGMMEEFGIGENFVRLGSSLFLIMYAFGCELWAPFSEEMGRKPVMQGSLWLVNLFALIAALCNNAGAIVAARTLGGLSSAGGSVTLGIVADMYSPYAHQYALGAIVLSSCGGSVVGPLIGGPIKYYINWRWIFWAQFLLGVFTALFHLLFCPETDVHTLKIAEFDRQRRDRSLPAGQIDPRSTREPLRLRNIASIMLRPFKMLATEPVVLSLSLLSGFSDALVFTCFESFGVVLDQYHFNDWQKGEAFVAIMSGNLVAFGLHCIDFYFQRADIAEREAQGLAPPAPERRLKALLYAGPLLPIGIFIFAGTSVPEAAHWAVPLFASMLIGIANFAIYMTTIDYMVAMYGKRYSASATGGNGFCRDLLAGVSSWYAKRLYQDLGPHLKIQKGSILLGCLAVALVAPIYLIYAKGSYLRSKSKLAEGLQDEHSVGEKYPSR